MADKKPTTKGGFDPLGDLRWAGAMLLGLFIVWLFTGGPERISSQKGPFIKPLSPLDTGEIYGIENKNENGEFETPSKWKPTNTKYITFSLPTGYRFVEDETAPYYKARITNDETTFFVEYGFKVTPISEFSDSDYYTSYEKINKDNAKISWPQNTKVEITGIFFDSLFGKKLKVYGESLSKSEQSIAFALFRTLDIK